MNPSLFPGYILDNVTVLELGRRIRPPEMRKKATEVVDSLIAQNKIIVPQEVYEELDYHSKDPGDEVLNWLKKRRGILRDLDGVDEANLQKVLKQFPDLVKQDVESPDADSHLVAMALSLDKKWTVVTRDGSGNSGLIKVADACDHYKIRWITEYDMLKENGWQV